MILNNSRAHFTIDLLLTCYRRNTRGFFLIFTAGYFFPNIYFNLFLFFYFNVSTAVFLKSHSSPSRYILSIWVV